MNFGVEPPFVWLISWLPPTAPQAAGWHLSWLIRIPLPHSKGQVISSTHLCDTNECIFDEQYPICRSREANPAMVSPFSISNTPRWEINGCLELSRPIVRALRAIAAQVIPIRYHLCHDDDNLPLASFALTIFSAHYSISISCRHCLKRDVGWHNDFFGDNFVDAKMCRIIFSVDMTDAPISSGGATEAFFVG